MDSSQHNAELLTRFIDRIAHHHVEVLMSQATQPEFKAWILNNMIDNNSRTAEEHAFLQDIFSEPQESSTSLENSQEFHDALQTILELDNDGENNIDLSFLDGLMAHPEEIIPTTNGMMITASHLPCYSYFPSHKRLREEDHEEEELHQNYKKRG